MSNTAENSSASSPQEASLPSAPAAAAQTTPTPQPRLRLWPAVVILVLQWAAVTLPARVAPGTMLHIFGMFLGPMAGTAALVGWWLFASRLPWRERWIGLLAFGAVAGGSFILYHESMRSMGIMTLAMYALPVTMTCCIAWLVVARKLTWRVRRAGLLVIAILTSGYFTLVRFEGVDGSMIAALPFRWQATAEDKYLASVGTTAHPTESSSNESTAQTLSLQPGDWPEFRGPNRDGRLTGVRLAADWNEHTPKPLWRHRVGPGWSSFAVVGDYLFTQEQRGEEEAVVCYDAVAGTQRWIHNDRARFMETLGGPGPRATPTFHEGRLYVLGATGILNCLDAASGAPVWSRDIVKDSGAAVPQWGFSSSPLVAEGRVTVFAGADEGKSVLAYDALSGDQAWAAGEGKHSYCSTQLSRLCGVEQVVVTTEQGTTAFDPTDGKVLWNHAWPVEMQRVIQPAIVGDSDVLIGTGMGIGLRRVHVDHTADGWSASEVWTTRAIKPYFNDLVIHGDFLYGFDSGLFNCVSLADGNLKWKARGYGNGEVLLLADQNLLLILSESGAVALVDAVPERHNERCRFQAIEGKTWNHPVVAHGKLFVRNSEEAACYELTVLPHEEVVRSNRE